MEPKRPAKSIDGVVRTGRPAPKPRPTAAATAAPQQAPAEAPAPASEPAPATAAPAKTKKPRRFLRTLALLLLTLMAVGGLAALYLFYYAG